MKVTTAQIPKGNASLVKHMRQTVTAVSHKCIDGKLLAQYDLESMIEEIETKIERNISSGNKRWVKMWKEQVKTLKELR